MITVLIVIGLIVGFVVGIGALIGGVVVIREGGLDNWFMGAIAALVGVACLVFTVMCLITATGGHDYFSTPDPCAETHMVGKTSYTEHHKGWYEHGGRAVWCGPGYYPGAR